MEINLDLADAGLVARDPVALIPASRSHQDVPMPWLPYLAVERSVDEFSGSWPEVRQRAVVQASFAFHQHKGTRRALDLALSPLGFSVRVVEWFEPLPRRPAYTFRINVTLGIEEAWFAIQRSELIRVANAAKNAHTKIEAINLIRAIAPSRAYVGGAPGRRRLLRVGQVPVPTTIRAQSLARIGILVRRNRTVTILPRP